MRFGTFSAFIAALLAPSPSDAQATNYYTVITYTGTVFDSNSQTGEFGGPGGSLSKEVYDNGAFGGPGGDLDGDTFVAQYVVNPSQAGVQYNFGAVGEEVYGSGYGMPLIAESLTINGITQVMYDNTFDSSFGFFSSSPTSQVSNTANTTKEYQGYFLSTYLYNAIYSNDSIYPSSLYGPYSGTTTGYDNEGYFLVETAEYYPGSVLSYASGYLTNTYLTVTEEPGLLVPPLPGAVPEPATWAMMLVGLGLIGFAVRRRQTVTVAYT